MTSTGERILLVESDPDISDLIARQALAPMGYQVALATDANAAIRQAVQAPPDLLIADLNLPGLSGKDLLVALNSQGIRVPVIVLAEKGQEQEVIHAFRLGATDYLLWQFREAEVVSAVERALRQVREAKERERLEQQLKTMNRALKQKVSELTTLMSLGKAVVSITDHRVLFTQIVDGAVRIVGADKGWFLLRDDENKKLYRLVAHRGLPPAWAKKMGQPLDDGISSLVTLSGEGLSIHGEALKRFRLSQLGKSALVIPVKAQQEVIGVLVVVREADRAFNRDEQNLLETVSDYASISLVNARLFRALSLTAETARNGEKRQNALLQKLRENIQESLQTATFSIDLLLAEKAGKLHPEQRQALETAQAALKRLSDAANQTIPPTS